MRDRQWIPGVTFVLWFVVGGIVKAVQGHNLSATQAIIIVLLVTVVMTAVGALRHELANPSDRG
jgi:hypothetical protein